MCVLTMTLGTTLTTALSASLTSAVGSTTAAITSGVVVGAGLAAVDGAIVGAAGSAISGGDIGKGAVQGLWMGAATGGIAGGAIEGLGAAGVLAKTPGMVGAAQAVRESTSTQELATMTGVGAEGAKSGSGGGILSGDKLVKAGVGAGSQLVGAGIQAYGAYQEGKDQSAALKAQAEAQRIAAKSELDAAEIEAKDLARRQRQVVGRGKVAAAANGVMLEGRAESSPAMWEQDAAAELAWDRDKLFYNANQRANALRRGANLSIVQAKNARKVGNLKSTTSLIKGGVGAAMSLWGNPSTSLYA